MSRTPVLLSALTLALLSGCATLTTSSSQTVTMMTDPPGAVCTFKRDGQVIGVINPTPGSVSVQKSHTPIDVACSKEGFVDAAGTVGTKFQPMTFGNILFGGLIGIVVDAASGASAEYEPQLTVRLTPSDFASATDRDRFFDQQRAIFAARSKQARERVAAACKPLECEQQLRFADEEEKSGLARIEAQRQSAKIKTP